MPWISRQHLELLESSRALLATERDGWRDFACDMIKHANQETQARLDVFEDRMPALLATAVRESAIADVIARAQVRADAEMQPPSIEAADKARVREARERERDQR